MSDDIDESANVQILCPGCRRPIVNFDYEKNEDGGRVTIDHEIPACEWWGSREARAWACELVTDVITSSQNEPSA